MSTDLLERPDRTAVPTPPGLCWTTIAGLSFIHLAGIAGLVWIVLNPSLPTLLMTAVLYVACGLGITCWLPPPLRPSHLPRRGAGPLGDARVRRGDVPELGAVVERRPPSPPRRHRRRRRPARGHPGRLVRPHRMAVPPTSGLGRRQLASPICGRCAASGCSTACTRSWRSASGSCSRPSSPRTWGDPWGGLLVAGFLRTAVMLQATFCINSLAHLIGHAPLRPRSSARDSVVTALVTFGEGYHSFHHRFPFDYRNGVALVAVRPEQVAHLDARSSPPRRPHPDCVGGQPNEGCGLGELMSSPVAWG